jgi:polar amino acid transport system substrate-binding protein
MRERNRQSRLQGTTGVIVAAVVVLLAGSCGSSGKKATTATTTGGSTATTTASLFSSLPPDVKTAKEIKVGSDVSYAPIEFFKEGTQQVQGVDYDIGLALGQRLGVKVTFINATFDGLIPALNSKRYDMLMSAMTDNKTRQGQVDFVDYFTAGTAILVQKGNPKHINSLDDLCGKTVALEKGTTQAGVADTQSKTCVTSGKAKINVLALDKDTDALQQLKIGRSDADMNDFPVAAYNAKTSGGGNDFEVTGQQFQSAPYGVALRKDSTQLRDAVQGALKAIISDRTYDKILTTWNVTAGALKTAQLNGGTGT